MLVGTVGGGLLGQVDLSVPYLVRSALLAAVFVVAYVVMHDVGFTPRRVTAGELPGEVARNARAGVEFGWGQPSLRLLMLAGLVQGGFLMWGFYASQPYLLELLDSDAIWIAGLVAAGVALSTIVGNQIVRVASRYCGRRSTLLLAAAAVGSGAAIVIGLAGSFWVALPALLLVMGAMGVTSPVRSAYLHQVVPSEQRATVVSFDSMVTNVGGIGGQVGLGALGEARSVGTAFVAGGLVTALALPLLSRLRRLGGPADEIVGESAGNGRPVRRERSAARLVGRDVPGGAARARGRLREGLTAARPARLARVPATVIVGAQWGDEGKGKIVDLLAQESDLVCRYQGGPNAGHTVVVGDETYKIRQIPTGVIAGKRCAIGAGCVVDPAVLISELDELESRGHETTGLVFVSGNAHLVMPWHIALDGARERRLGRLQIGTTRRGIGPAYADKATRIGIRVQDLLDPKILRQKLELAVQEKNVWLQRVYELEPFEVEDVVSAQLAFAERLAPYVADTSLLVDRALRGERARALRGRAGHAPRPRPRHLSVRDLVQPDRRRRRGELRHRPEPHRRGARRREGVRDACGRGPVPERDRGTRPRAGPVARQRVRHGDRARAALRLARPRGASLRRARERHHLARVDEARRPLRVLRASRVRALPPAGRLGDRGLPGSSERLPPLPAGVRGAARLG